MMQGHCLGSLSLIQTAFFLGLSCSTCHRSCIYWLCEILPWYLRKCMTYGSETWEMKSSSVERIEKAEMRMVRWMCRASLCERKKNEDLLQSMGLVRIGQVMRKSRPRWYGHVARREETHWLQRILNFPVAGRKPCGRSRKTWEETITEHRRASNITHIDPTDRTAWRTAIKEMNCPTPQSGNNGL